MKKRNKGNAKRTQAKIQRRTKADNQAEQYANSYKGKRELEKLRKEEKHRAEVQRALARERSRVYSNPTINLMDTLLDRPLSSRLFR